MPFYHRPACGRYCALLCAWAGLLTGCVWVLGLDRNENLFPADGSSIPPACGTAPSYRSTVIQDEPSAYFRLGESAGATTAADELSMYPGTYSTTGVQLGIAGALLCDSNTAANFDGTSGTLIIGDHFDFAQNAPFTFEFWVRVALPLTDSETRRIFGKTPDADDAGYLAFVTAGNTQPASPMLTFKRVATNDLSDADTIQVSLSANAWHYIAVTYDGLNLNAYVDGALGTALATATRSLGATPGSPLTLASEHGYSNWFSGDLDEFAIYEKALTGEQVRTHYGAGIGN